MSQILDQIKLNFGKELSKMFRYFKANMNKTDWAEFESWFWKIRPYLEVDTSKYNSSIRVQESKELTPEKLNN